jgi:hypothetical protein
MPLLDILINYRAAITECQGFIGIAFQQNAAGTYIHPQNQRQFISESAFLRIFISWERFLESSFVNFLLGEPAIPGHTINRFASPTNIDQAQRMLIGTQKYVDWSNPEIVRKLSRIYFDTTNPINSTVSAVQPDLFDLKTIRNSAAHVSSTTIGELDALATRKLGVLTTNATVSQVIFGIAPNTGNTILTDYLALLDTAAETIANG